MKKIIASILLVVLCMTLVACGGPKYLSDEDFMACLELVELTTENYMDYLEIGEFEDYDDFGNATGDTYIGIKIKDGYAPVDLETGGAEGHNLLIKVTYTSAETDLHLDETTGEWVETYPNAEPWVYEGEEDVRVYEEDISYLTSCYSVADDKKTAWSREVTDIQIMQIKGAVFKATLPEDGWQTNDSGKQFMLIGSKEGYSKLDNDEYLILDLQDAIVEARQRQAANAE